MDCQRTGRTLAKEATVLLLIVSGATTLSAAVHFQSRADLTNFTISLGVSAFYFILGITCWLRRRISFLVSLVTATVFAGFIFGILYSTIGILLFLLQLQIVFFAYRAYNEPDSPSSPTTGLVERSITQE